MVRYTTYQGRKQKYLKILYWGPYQSGKTTILDTLYKIIKQQDKDIIPEGDITKIQRAGGATLYFDRVVFADILEESSEQERVFYQIYTVVGAKRFAPIRKKVFRRTDSVIFVFDSQKSRLKENIESLKELKEISKGKLVKKIPLTIMLNKQDLPETVNRSEVEQILKDEGLMFESDDPSYTWNPIIFETIGLYDKHKNVYEAFMECAYRTKLYLEDKKTTKTARINLTLTEELKNEWEIFARDVLNKSLSQMIRDAVREYRNKYIQSEEVQDTLEAKIEKIISEKMEKIMEKLKLKDDEA
jgi:GTPase SAR1 family protein